MRYGIFLLALSAALMLAEGCTTIQHRTAITPDKAAAQSVGLDAFLHRETRELHITLDPDRHVCTVRTKEGEILGEDVPLRPDLYEAITSLHTDIAAALPYLLPCLRGSIELHCAPQEGGSAILAPSGAAFWVREGKVYAGNDVARRAAPELEDAPETITYDELSVEAEVVIMGHCTNTHT